VKIDETIIANDCCYKGRGNEEGPRKVVTGLLLAEEDRTGSFDKQLARIRAQTATLPDKNPYAALIYLTMYLTEGLLGISLLDQLIERNPSNPYLYINRGRRLGQIGEHRFLQGFKFETITSITCLPLTQETGREA